MHASFRRKASQEFKCLLSLLSSFIATKSCLYGFKQSFGILVLTECQLMFIGSAISNMLLALTSFFFCAFSLVVTGPSIVEVECRSANPTALDLNKESLMKVETQEDEFVHTPDDYVPTDDETHDVDDEEYDRINKEMYDDVNVDLKDVELVDEGKFQAGPQATTTASPAQVASLSRSVSSNYEGIQDTRNVDHNSAVHAAIKFEVPIVVKEYLGTNLEDSFHKVIQKQIADFIHEHTIPVAVVTDVPNTKQNPKHMALYHALMESILKDKDAMNKGVADKLKKRKPDDVDRDKDPLAGSDQGLKRRKTKETVFEAGDTQLPQNLGEDMGKTDEPPIVKADLKDWFKKPKRPPTPDLKWNTSKTVDDGPTQN
ncbi:hypothetical protein Tco_0489121 [Tanacetum coccineum]